MVRLGAHRTGTPRIEKLSSAGRISVRPELLKIFFHQVAANTLEVIFQQLAQFDGLFVAEILRTL